MVAQGREHVKTKFGDGGCPACLGSGSLAITVGAQDALAKALWIVEGFECCIEELWCFIPSTEML